MSSELMGSVKSINDMILNHVLIDGNPKIELSIPVRIAFPIMMNSEEGHLEILVVDNHWKSVMHVKLSPIEDNTQKDLTYIAEEMNRYFDGKPVSSNITHYTLTITDIVHNKVDVRNISSIDVSELGYASEFYERQINEIYKVLAKKLQG
jgi:hypothetical protein